MNDATNDSNSFGCGFALAILLALIFWFVLTGERMIERDRRACEERGGHYVHGYEHMECIQ